MGSKEINPVILIITVVVVLAVIGYFGMRAMQPPQPPPGSYTPGVPPWLDKNHPQTAAPGVHSPTEAGAAPARGR